MELVKQPLLTIAIPTYNSGQFIEATLLSISRQVTKEIRDLLQIVIVDNASTDLTPQILAEFNFPCHFKIIRNPINMGPDFSLDKCGFEADGKYIWFLGSQDKLLPNTLENVMGVCGKEEYSNILLNFSVENELDSNASKPNHYMIYQDLVINDSYKFYRKLGGHALAMSANIISKESYSIVMKNSLVTINWALYQRYFDSTFLKNSVVKFYFISDPVFILMQESDGWWTTPWVFINFIGLREIHRTAWRRNFKLYLLLTYRYGGKALVNSIHLGRRAGYKPNFIMLVRLISLCFFDPRTITALFALYSPSKALRRFDVT